MQGWRSKLDTQVKFYHEVSDYLQNALHYAIAFSVEKTLVLLLSYWYISYCLVVFLYVKCLVWTYYAFNAMYCLEKNWLVASFLPF